jgi:multicomponent Na+:H+ antiporter subunit E
LVVVWLVLWGRVSVANLVSGSVVALVVVAIAGVSRSGQVHVRPGAAARFVARFAVQLVVATAVVAREVVARRSRIRTGIVAVPLRGCSDGVATLIADTISLTPGTLTVEVRSDPLTLYVHVLHLRDVEQVRRSVRRIEVLAVRAFGSAEARAGLDVDDTRTMEAR